MFEIGDIVIWRDRLWRISGEVRLSGAVLVVGLKGEGRRYASIECLIPAVGLLKELY